MIKIKEDELDELNNLLKDKKLFIFDFDGTIANTEEYQWKSYNAVLKKYNIELSLSDIKRYIGNNEYFIYEQIKKDFYIDFDNELFREERMIVYFEIVKNLEPFSYINYLIKERSFKTVEFSILSAQKEEVILMFLKRWNIAHHFNKIISVLDTNTSKDKVLQDVYSFYGYENVESVLFEDVDKNLEYAKLNQLVSVGISHLYNNGELPHADILI